MSHEETSQSALNTSRVEEFYHAFGGGVSLSGTTNAIADTETAFTHTLGRIPRGWFVRSRDKGGVLYNGGTADTDTLVHIKSDLVSVAFEIYLY